MTDPLRLLSLGPVIAVDAVHAAEASAESVTGWPELAARLDAPGAFDAALVDGDAAPATPIQLAAIAPLVPIVVVVDDPDAVTADDWLRQGADEIVGRDDVASGVVWRRVRQAIARRSGATWRGAAYSTDPDTGLPHRQQLVEHLSQLLALREREPSPMAVLALRVFTDVAGVAAFGAAGSDAVNAANAAVAGGAPAERAILRRKVGVRLRAGVRASDVVAAIDDQSFAVLLGAMLAPGDAERVAAKLVAALIAPFAVGGGERSLAVSFGIAHSPQDGRDAEPLLRRALALAEAAPAVVGSGPAPSRDAAGAARTAANDDA